MALGNHTILRHGTLRDRSRIEFHIDFVVNVLNGDGFQIILFVVELLVGGQLGMIVDSCVKNG